MAPAADVAECVERLLRGFRTYDRTVDVVSAFEMAYTESRSDVPETVRHFERFPRIPVDGEEQPLTPDFTVVFTDGGGLVGEIARIALRDESVDSLCRQIQKYDSLRQLPIAGGVTDVAHVDVLLLVPQDVGPATAMRVLDDRLSSDEHPYKPDVAPCIVQFGYDEGRYLFQRLLHARNGMPRDGDRADGLSRWFAENGDFRARPSRFSHIKAAKAFANDSADPLYLATHLWAKTFATLAGERADEAPVTIEVVAAELGAELRETYGGVVARDVEGALELLASARLAERDTSGGWVVKWEELRLAGEHELERILATRVCRPPTVRRSRRSRDTEPPAEPQTLF